MTPTKSRNGNALLMTMIALAILMMIVAAAIQFTGTNREAATAKARGDEMQACAVNARKMLLAKLRTFGVPTGGLVLQSKIPDAQTTGEQRQVLTGHFGATAPEAVIVKIDSTTMGASRDQVRDVSNTLASTTLGGDYYRVIVTCRHPSSNAESELEFTFRHGL